MKPLRLALPKGRLLAPILDLFVTAGLAGSDARDPGRRLVLALPQAQAVLGRPVEIFLLKNADVPTYVEHGVADAGVAGTDVLDESLADVLRPWTLPFGRCRVSLAAREAVDLHTLAGLDTVRIATKYPVIAGRFVREAGWNAELIRLGGSVELGAVLGLADAIIDLVETGRTLRENRLHEVLPIGETRVMLIANRALSASTLSVVDRLIGRLDGAVASPPPETST